MFADERGELSGEIVPSLFELTNLVGIFLDEVFLFGAVVC